MPCIMVDTPLSADKRPAILPHHQQSGRDQAGLDTPGAAHSFVPIMSDNGVRLEAIADLVGHKNATVTARVYRHQLRPVITQGAEAMDTIFSQPKDAKSA